MRLKALGFGVAFLVALMSSSASAGVITITNSLDGNFDDSSGFRGFTVTGLEAGYGSGVILDVDISINFAKADGESFDPPYPGGTPFHNEIHFRLDDPTDDAVTLIAPGSWGGAGALFDGTITFDQAAATVVNAGAVPVAGTFRPTGAGSLDDYNGQLAVGLWELFIEDTVGLDSLRFREATLTIITEDFRAVPEPSTFALLGLGGVAAVIARRRARR
jgi:hypothetical protein